MCRAAFIERRPYHQNAPSYSVAPLEVYEAEWWPDKRFSITAKIPVVSIRTFISMLKRRGQIIS